jgi:ABC-type branched-subunit amino acid transport system ATPase component
MIRIFPQIRVMENMLLALETDKKEGLFCAMNPFGKYSSRSLEEKARKMLSLVELEKESDKYAGELSHGNRRLLEVLRTIALDADLFLFDEPTAGVFSEIKTRILELFRRLISQGKTVIFVEHNMDTVREAAERVIVLHKGKILADGRPESVLESQPVVEAYFGG